MSFPTVSIKYINTEQKTSVLEKKNTWKGKNNDFHSLFFSKERQFTTARRLRKIKKEIQDVASIILFYVSALKTAWNVLCCLQ